MVSRTAKLLLLAALTAATLHAAPVRAGGTAPAITDAGPQDACRRVGEGRFRSAHPARCQGVWLVFASDPGGGIWWHDKDGTDPQARQLRRKASSLQLRLTRCGIRSFVSLSDWFDRFTPGLMVVHSAPYANAALAGGDLRRAQRCAIAGYAKFSELQIVGRD